MDMHRDRTLTAPTCLTSLTHESAEDFTLPDYMPAIRRVITVTARPLPESRFLTGSSMEFGGTVTYAILYLGEGDEIYCAPLSSEYSGSVALGDCILDDASSVGIDTAAESVNCRVIGPRKLSMKCRMKTKISAYAPTPLEETVTDAAGRPCRADGSSLEKLICTAPNVRVSRGEITATAGGALDRLSGAKILLCDGVIRVEDARPGTDSVTVTGDAIVHLLCLSPDGTVSPSTAKSRFSEVLSVPGAAEGDHARGWGRCAAVTVNTADEGDPSWEIEFDLEAESVAAAETAYTADAYATDCGSRVEFAERDSLRRVLCGVGSLSVSGEGGRQSKSTPGEKILHADAAVTPDHVEYSEEKRRLILHGTAAVRVVIGCDGEVMVEEFTLPIRYETEGIPPAAGGEMLWRCTADVCDIRARPAGDRIAVDMDLSLSMTVLSREKIRCVREIALEADPVTGAEEGRLRICYPDPGETIWEVGKRYRACQKSLCEKNGLPDAHAKCGGEPILV